MSNILITSIHTSIVASRHIISDVPEILRCSGFFNLIYFPSAGADKKQIIASVQFDSNFFLCISSLLDYNYLDALSAALVILLYFFSIPKCLNIYSEFFMQNLGEEIYLYHRERLSAKVKVVISLEVGAM